MKKFNDKHKRTEYNMEERTIKIGLKTAKEWFNKGGELKDVALQAYTEKELKVLPKTWEECFNLLSEDIYINEHSNIINIDIAFLAGGETCHNTLPTGLGKPMLALCQLLVCREIYRQGWKPDWSNDDTIKYSIVHNNNKIETGWNLTTSTILSFQSIEVRDEFLENFRELIEEAKELI